MSMDYGALIKRGRSWRNNNFRQETNEPRCIIAEMETAIETMLEEWKAAGWINVKERLPEPWTFVLTIDADDSVKKWNWESAVVLFDGEQGDLFCDAGGGYRHFTHWMPLPEPPDYDKLET